MLRKLIDWIKGLFAADPGDEIIGDDNDCGTMMEYLTPGEKIEK